MRPECSSSNTDELLWFKKYHPEQLNTVIAFLCINEVFSSESFRRNLSGILPRL